MGVKKFISNFALGFVAGLIFIAVLLCNNTGASIADSLYNEVFTEISDAQKIEIADVSPQSNFTVPSAAIQLQKSFFKYRVKGKCEKVRFDGVLNSSSEKTIFFAGRLKLFRSSCFARSHLGDHSQFRGPPSISIC